METEISEKEIEEKKKYFDIEVWPQIKKETKEMSKRESCFFSFLAGSLPRVEHPER